MSVTHQQIMETAIRLAADSAVGGLVCESDLRSSASRAYYASLHAAFVALPADFAPDSSVKSSASSHMVLIDAVTLWAKSVRPGRSDARVVARNLQRLKSIRKKADYEISEMFPVEHASDALTIAAETIVCADRAGASARALTA